MRLPDHLSDFDLIEDVFIRVAGKEKTLGVSALAPNERVVYFIWSALGILGNGSFQYFYETGMSEQEVAVSLETLDLKQPARYFREASQMISQGGWVRDWNEKLQCLKMHEADFDLLAQEILYSEAEIEQRLANYIRSWTNTDV